MANFGQSSEAALSTVDPRLVRVLRESIKYVDFRVLVGHRGKEAQDEAFRTKKSQKPWPTSEHNSLPSKAVDIVPWPLDWNDIPQFIYVAGIIIGVGLKMGVPLRVGFDWNVDRKVDPPKSFKDWGHVELQP